VSTDTANSTQVDSPRVDLTTPALLPTVVPAHIQERALNKIRQARPTKFGTSSGWFNVASLMAVEAVWLLAMVACGVGLAWSSGLSLRPAIASLTIWLLGVVSCFYLLGLYRVVTALPAAELRRMVLALIGSAFFMACSQVTLMWHHPIQMMSLLLAPLLATFTLPFVRHLSRSYLAKSTLWGRRVLIVGGDARSAAILAKLEYSPHLGLRPVGVLEDLEELHNSIPEQWCLGTPEKLSEAANNLNVSMAVLVPQEVPTFNMVDLYHASEKNINTWMVVPLTHNLPALWTEAHDMTGQVALGWHNHLTSLRHRFMKRTFDLICVALLLPFLMSLIGLIWLAIKITCGGDAYFIQERIGLRGRKFRCYKFRTMHPNGDAILEQYFEEHPEKKAEWSVNFKLKNDPRVTWIGKLLRKTSLDELPQLFNVMRGEMSLVGPRPLLESELGRYGNAYESYILMVPGITGLWQISGRSNTTFADRAWYDEYYVRNWSPWLDVYILGCTAKVVLRCEGAY
jgi:Undecaprenyl-phosphate galactose phosphotransferase WbaP